MNVILILCIIILFYIHLREQFKTSNYLELYEILNPSRTELRELCDTKQPILVNDEIFGMSLDALCCDYGQYEINIREVCNSNTNTKNKLVFLSDGMKLLDTDSSDNKIFISDNNTQFIIDSQLNISLLKLDDLLRPIFTVKYSYDLNIGSKNFTSLLKSNMHSSYYIMVMDGEMELKLFPPINYKHLYNGIDITGDNFTSKINVWDTQYDTSDKLGKTVSMTMTVKKGHIFFVPSHWWYSYKFNAKTILYTAKYITLMNLISNIKFTMLSLYTNN